MAGNGETKTFPDQKPLEPWFGYERFSSTLAAYPVEVLKAPITWDERHVERLLATCESRGLVPTLSASIEDGSLNLAQLQIFSPTLHQRLAMSRNLSWEVSAGIAVTTARAVDNGHLLGLRHGGLSPKSVSITSDSVSVSGMGLGRKGVLPADLVDFAGPEVIAGGTPGVRSDVYSLGKILAASLAKTNGSGPPALIAIAETATSEDLMDRYPTAGAFADAVVAAAGDTMTAYELADFNVSPLSGVPAGLPVSAGLFSDDTFIDLTDGPTEQGEDNDDGPLVVPSEVAAVAGAGSTAAVGATGAGSGSGWGLLVGILGIGALIVGGALWIGSSDDATTSTTTATSVTATTLAPTTTALPTTAATTTEAPATTAAPTTSAPPTTAAPTTTTPPTTTTTPTTAATTSAPSTTAGPTTTEDIIVIDGETPVELLQALPQGPVDVYANGELLVAGFEPETIAGPVALNAGSQNVEIFPAAPSPASLSSDRSENPTVIGRAELVPNQATSVAVHPNAAGEPQVSTFADNRLAVPAGKSRLNLRHLATTGPLQLTIDGSPVGSQIRNADDLEVELVAGQYDLALLDADGTELLAAKVDAAEGSATTVSAATGADGGLVAIVQRVEGLDTAPGQVPTGNSGLKATTSSPWLAVVLLLVGFAALSAALGASWQKRRSL